MVAVAVEDQNKPNPNGVLQRLSSKRSSLKNKLKVGHRQSWRVSLRKRKECDETRIVRFQGISLEKLIRIHQKIMLDTDIKDLYVLEEDVEGIAKGTTLELEEEGEDLYRVACGSELIELDPSQVTIKPREDWSVDDVCEFFVLPRTLKTDSIYIDRIKSKYVGQPYRCAFVCHPHSAKFTDLIDVLVNKYTGRAFEEVFIWLDTFCANQPLLTRKANGLGISDKEREGFLASNLHRLIDRFEERLVYFGDMECPEVLRRAWCVWELYGISKSRENFDILFHYVYEVKDSLKEGSIGNMMDAVRGHLEARELACRNRLDASIIDKLILQLPGQYDLVVDTITSKILRWVLEQIEKCIKESVSSNDQDDDPRPLLINGGNFMLETGETEVALSYFRKALELGIDDEVEEADVKGNMAVIYGSQGDHVLALDLYQQVLPIYLERKQFDDIADTYHNMGAVLETQEDHEQALVMYEKALELKNDLTDASFIVKTHSNIAMLLHNLQRTDNAKDHMTQAFQLTKSQLGDQHPETLRLQTIVDQWNEQYPSQYSCLIM